MDRDATLHVLDPRAWQTTLDDRNAIAAGARKLANDRNWLRNVLGPDVEDPIVADWAECAQEVEGDNTNTFTILNAWALAMGLHLNPAFRVNQSPDFHSQAQRLFDLAPHDLLDWKLLLAFLKCKSYVLNVDDLDPKGKGKASPSVRRGSRTEEDDGLPPSNRRFDLRGRGFDELLARQVTQDTATPKPRDGNQIELSNDATTIHLGHGLPGYGDFTADYDAEGFVNQVVIPVVEHGRWRLSVGRDELQEIVREISPSPQKAKDQGQSAVDVDVETQTTETVSRPPQQPLKLYNPVSTIGTAPRLPNKPTSPPKTTSPSKLTSPTKPMSSTKPTSPGKPAAFARLEVPKAPQVESCHPDATLIPPDFDPCNYYRTKLAELRQTATALENPSPVRLNTEQMFYRIAPVVRALNELYPSGEGFTLYATEEHLTVSQLDSNIVHHDQIVVRLHKYGDRTLLLLLQFFQDEVTAHVIDPAPWSWTPEQRDDLFQSVLGLAGLFNIDEPDRLYWISGLQEDKAGLDPWQSDYLNVLSAWTILLRLPLSMNIHGFQAPDHFFEDSQQIIQAVVDGRANWKLIWAFLRCTNYVAGDAPPAPRRRFARTVPIQDRAQHEARMRARPAPTSGSSEETSLNNHFSKTTGYAHTLEFPWDAPPAKGSASTNSFPLSSVKNRSKNNNENSGGDEDYETSENQGTGILAEDNGLLQDHIRSLDLPEDFTPCRYFNTRRNELLAMDDVSIALATIRQIATTRFGE